MTSSKAKDEQGKLSLVVRIGVFVYRYLAGTVQFVLVLQEIVSVMIAGEGNIVWYPLGIAVLNLSGICYGISNKDKVFIFFCTIVAVEYVLWCILSLTL